MDFRAWNRKKNLMLRALKARAARFILDRKTPAVFTPQTLPSIRKIVFLRHDNKLGDMIVSTLAFRELKKRLPQAEISVIAGPAAAKIIENNPNVKNIFLYTKSLPAVWKLGKRLQQERFDLFIDMDKESTLESLLLLRLAAPRFAFGFNRQDIRLYNITAPFGFSQHHVTRWHQKVLEVLGLLQDGQPFDGSYDLSVPAPARQAARAFLNTLPLTGKRIIFNPFAASKHRCFSFRQAKQTALFFPNGRVILVGPAGELDTFGKGETFPPNLIKAPQELCQTYGVWASLALLAEADLLVSPDTYIVHAAAALKKPVCAPFTPVNKTEWRPLGKSFILDVTEGQDFNSVDLSILLKHASHLLKE